MATIYAKTITVSTAGSAVQVSTTPRPFVWALFHIPPGNTGDIYIGDINVSSTNGFSLQKLTANVTHLDNIVLDGKRFAEDPPLDLKDFYVDAVTSGDKVEVLAKVL
jgi:hypothetical protein